MLAGSEQQYAVERKIASGGMATVYLGRGLGALGFQRPVAIKICHPHLLEGEHRLEAVLDEARIAARIHHPNVVGVLDVVVRDGSVMIVMEYVEGLTVAGLVRAAAKNDTRVPVDIALRVALDALAGLHAAHELRDEGRDLGVVHRDVSPQNILVGVDGFAKLADFGVFKATERLAPSTETGELKGKLGYVPPEAYRGERITRRADLYALGVVLWELLAGRRLFEVGSHAAILQLVLAGRIPQLASLRDDVPCELDAVLARAFASDPEQRFATAEEFARALERLPVSAASPRALAEHTRHAMGVIEPPAAAAPTDDVDPSALSAVPPIEDVLTPSEYVTPVRATLPPSRTRTRARTIGGLVIGAALIAVGALAGTLRTTWANGTAASPRTLHTMTVLEGKAAWPSRDRDVKVPRADDPPKARARLPGSIARPPATPSPAPPAAASARSFYDPAEL